MTQITTQGIVDILNTITIDTIKKRSELAKKKEELQNTDLWNEIQDLEFELKELVNKDSEVREQGKQLLLSKGLKKFEGLDGTIVQLNKIPGKLIIENEDIEDLNEYRKEKVTVSLDKRKLKEDIKEGLIIDGVYIQEDYKLEVKNK